jgi:hypothetical protein
MLTELLLFALQVKTRIDLLVNTIETLNKINDTFIGVILILDYQATYGSYYKYYYYYCGSEKAAFREMVKAAN